jgi:SAM-dependent methyltransferase
MTSADYRQRIYAAYVRSAPDLTGRTTLADMAPRRPYLSQLVARHFPPARAARILELGCGPGALIHVARAMGYENLAGVDRSPEQVAIAAALGISGVREGELMAALKGAPAESHDAIIAFDVIEHFTKAEILEFVDEVRRVLAPGGRFIVHTCNAESPFFGASFHRDFTHETAFTRHSIAQLLLASGFASVRCFEDRPVPHGARSAVRALLWHAFRAGLRLYRAAETGDTGRDAIFSTDFLAVAVK